MAEKEKQEYHEILSLVEVFLEDLGANLRYSDYTHGYVSAEYGIKFSIDAYRPGEDNNTSWLFRIFREDTPHFEGIEFEVNDPNTFPEIKKFIESFKEK